jgi:hypothetical protein
MFSGEDGEGDLGDFERLKNQCRQKYKKNKNLAGIMHSTARAIFLEFLQAFMQFRVHIFSTGDWLLVSLTTRDRRDWNLRGEALLVQTFLD